MRIIVCGGRDLLDGAVVFAGLDLVVDILGPVTSLFEGGQRTYDKEGRPIGGADFWGWRWAVERGVPWMTIKAEWSRWGGQAGPMRNSLMLRHRPDAVVGFPGGDGTADMLNKACREGIPRVIFDHNGRIVPSNLQECK